MSQLKKHILSTETVIIEAKFSNYRQELMLTNFRILAVNKHTLSGLNFREIPIKKLESIDVKQSLVGRIFNYGTLVIKGQGGSLIRVPYVKNPYEFKNLAMESIYK